MSEEISVTPRRNGNTVLLGRPVTWELCLKALATIALAVSGWFLKASFERLDAHENRLTRIEARSESTDESIRELKQGIRDINGKLDRLIERRP